MVKTFHSFIWALFLALCAFGTPLPGLAATSLLRCSSAHVSKLSAPKIPIIPRSEIQDRSQAFNGEHGIAKLKSGTYKGQPVVIKHRNLTSRPQDTATLVRDRKTDYEKDLRDEALWLLELNKFNIGVKLFGLSKVSGVLGLVMEQVTEPHLVLKLPMHPGMPLDPGLMKVMERYIQAKMQEGFKVTEETYKELDRVLEFMVANEIMAHDLQFLLTKSGRLVLIDPELFKKYNPTEEIQTPEELAFDQGQIFKAMLSPYLIN